MIRNSLNPVLFCLWAILCAVPLLSGCSLHKSPQTQTSYYQLNYPAPEPSFPHAGLPYVIRVCPFQSSDLYSRQGIVFQDGPHLTSRYVYHQWISPLDRMLPRMFARDLRQAGIVRGVFLNGGEASTHRLAGSLEAFYEDDAKDPWEAVAAVNVTFIDARARDPAEQIVFQKTYKCRRPCSANRPDAFVEAASQAVADLSGQLTADIYETLDGLKKDAN